MKPTSNLLRRLSLVAAFGAVACSTSRPDAAPPTAAERVGSVAQRLTFNLLHSFTGDAADGEAPGFGDLTLAGSTLYGMTYAGGASDLGSLFKVDTDGTGFSLLHSFASGTSDGSLPDGSLTLSGSTLSTE